MGVASTTNTEIYTGDGSTLTFSFPFYFFTKDDLYVYIYDTVAGTIALKVRGTHYVVTATANAQGLYPSGGLVDFTGLFGAPSTTQLVVISRTPLEQQNYALLTGGTISSAAIVQQFDYLTLLVQSLQDQVNRCLKLPAGFGPTFDPTLPATVALAASETLTLIVNAAANGISLGASTASIAAAATSAAAAAASATAAAGSATAAASSATSASGSATAASGSAVAAAASAVAAAASAGSVGTPFQEVLTGTFAAGNTTFTMSHAAVAATLLAILGGVPQAQGVSNDYTVSGVTITFTGVDVSAQSLIALYRY